MNKLSIYFSYNSVSEIFPLNFPPDWHHPIEVWGPVQFFFSPKLCGSEVLLSFVCLNTCFYYTE